MRKTAPHSVTLGKLRGGMTILSSSLPSLSPSRQALGCGCTRLNAHERHSSGLSLGDISVRSHGKRWRFPRLIQGYLRHPSRHYLSNHPFPLSSDLQAVRFPSRGSSYSILTTKAQDSNVAMVSTSYPPFGCKSLPIWGWRELKGCASLSTPPPRHPNEDLRSVQ